MQPWDGTLLISARRAELLNELSNSYENISGFPLDVTDKAQSVKKYLMKLKTNHENIDICFFSTGTWDPKKEKELDVEQMEDVFKVNFFGTVNCIKRLNSTLEIKKNGHNNYCFINWI